MSPDSIRLFVAATPPREHLEWARARTQELHARWPAARWTPVANQHVTVKFLGATPTARLDDVVSACRGAAGGVAPGPIGLEGLGAFPSVRRAKVLWLGLADPDGVLGALARALDPALEPLGFAPERRPFSPHLTVARFRAPEDLRPLPALEDDPPEPVVLAEVALWRSHLSPKGARYEALERLPLGRGDGA